MTDNELVPRVKIGSQEVETKQGMRYYGIISIDGEVYPSPWCYETKEEAVKYGIEFVQMHGKELGVVFAWNN